jgi:rod shape-determining protein MreC
VGQLRLANRFLKTELEMAERARALALFRDRTPSKVLAARVIGTSAGLNSRVVFVDRGSTDGIRKGMAVLVPEGIVGKVVQAYPTASQVMLATSQGFAAGVISQKNRVRGTLKGLGSSLCPVEYIENEDKVEAGEWFYTSGDDRIFPRGLPVGTVKTVREGRGSKEVTLEPSGLRGGIDEVLIVVEGVHGLVPDPPRPSSNEVQILPPPPEEASPEENLSPASRALPTDADRLRERYRRVGDSQGHNFGANPGRPPDFNRPVPASPKPAAPKPPDPPPPEVQP